jgi:hypothetical protein
MTKGESATPPCEYLKLTESIVWNLVVMKEITGPQSGEAGQFDPDKCLQPLQETKRRSHKKREQYILERG